MTSTTPTHDSSSTPSTPGPRGRRRFTARSTSIGVAVIGIVAVLLLGGFAATRGGATPSPPDLADRTFESTEVRGHRLVDGTTVRITFEDDHVSAQAGCNTVFGAADWSDGVLEAPRLASTMMACSTELLAQDTWLGALLESSPSITLDGPRLTIAGSSTLVLVEVES